MHIKLCQLAKFTLHLSLHLEVSQGMWCTLLEESPYSRNTIAPLDSLNFTPYLHEEQPSILLTLSTLGANSVIANCPLRI